MSNLKPIQPAQLPATLSTQEIQVCVALNVFNQLRAFKLTDVEILEWKDTLMRVMPGLTDQVLQMAIDGMITGEIPYDQNQGIKNIIDAIKRIDYDEKGKLKIFKPHY